MHVLAPAFELLNEGDHHARLASTNGIAAALFTSPNCGTCRVWKRLLPLALSGIVRHCFEVDVTIATGVARCFGIFHLPMIYLYHDGRCRAELQAEARIEGIRAQATHLLNSPPQEAP